MTGVIHKSRDVMRNCVPQAVVENRERKDKLQEMIQYVIFY